MKCKQTEKDLLKSLDERLNPSEAIRLEEHLDDCPLCQKRQSEYRIIRKTLKEESIPETKPFFWERLQPKLKGKRTIEPWTVGKQFGLRAIPLSILVVVLFTAAVFLFVPSPREELDLSQTGVFLLENLNPLEETQSFLSEEGDVNKHLMLIFSSLDETGTIRRYFP